jgi:hypothetical protein
MSKFDRMAKNTRHTLPDDLLNGVDYHFYYTRNSIYFNDIMSGIKAGHGQDVYDKVLKELNGKTTVQSWLFKLGFFHTEKSKNVETKFNEYAKMNPWMKDYYEFCLDNRPYVPRIDINNIAVSNWTRISKGDTLYNEFKSNFDWKHFALVTSSKNLVVYCEVTNPAPFVAGNIVQLRDKYRNQYGHDPFYGRKGLHTADRLGTVIEILNKVHGSSYGGKGSRLVLVHWAASNEASEHSVNSLKLLNRKDKMVDKLVDWSHNET